MTSNKNTLSLSPVAKQSINIRHHPMLPFESIQFQSAVIEVPSVDEKGFNQSPDLKVPCRNLVTLQHKKELYSKENINKSLEIGLVNENYDMLQSLKF